ncbi:hypothetical protein Efla_005922 [Eimeria flavescens]
MVHEPAGCTEALQSDPFALPSFEQISEDLNNKGASIALKMSHLFALREKGGPEAAKLLLHALKDRNTVNSAANLLGQLGCIESVPFLEGVLADFTEDEIVRHEVRPMYTIIVQTFRLNLLLFLAAYLKDSSVPVQQTCEVAIDFLKHKKTQLENGKQRGRKSCFNTVDPSEGYEGCTAADTPRLLDMLMDKDLRLWERYRALATLRDLRTPPTTAALGRALRHDNTSALLRHEIAFALGQIRFPPAVAVDPSKTTLESPHASGNAFGVKPPPLDINPEAAAAEGAQALVYCLGNSEDHPMARHEAALALGSLASDGRAATCSFQGKILRDAVVEVLQTYLKCSEKIVAESCLVALSNMQDEWNMSFGV